MPCVIVYGVAKTVTYEVGEKVSQKKGKTSWNAVYVDGEWRLVHTYWAAHVALGYKTGRWAVVDSDVNSRKSQSVSKSVTKSNIGDYYFLTDPDKFIIRCFPENSAWQLLKKPLSRAEFEEQPFTQPTFHELKLKDMLHDSCVVHANEGKAKFEFQMLQDRIGYYQFGYKLYARRDPEAEGEYDVMTLERYCLHYQHEDRAFFEVRFPVIGVYKLEVHCNDARRQLPSTWVCDYKVVCKETVPDCQPLPAVPEIGWGPGEELRSTGMECLTHLHPLVDLDKEITTFIRFALPKNRQLDLDVDLVTNNMPSEALKSHVTLEQDGDHMVIQITPPGEGEYALQIYVKEEKGRENILNYLLQRSRVVEVCLQTSGLFNT